MKAVVEVPPFRSNELFYNCQFLRSAYVGVDEYRSKLAVLREQFTPDPVSTETASFATVNGRSIWNPSL